MATASSTISTTQGYAPVANKGKKYKYQARDGRIYVGLFDLHVQTSAGVRWRLVFANPNSRKAMARPDCCSETNDPLSEFGPNAGYDDAPQGSIGSTRASTPPEESWPPS